MNINAMNSQALVVPAKTAHYYVDESGDGVLFGAQGRSLLSANVVNKHFILGMLAVERPDTLASDLQALRAELLADPYYKSVPSMRIDGRKTGQMFHAKDDVPEVRREVFRLLQKHPIKLFAVVRDMRSVLAIELERKRLDEKHRYRPDGLYDSTVSLLFKERLHEYTDCHINFSKRGQADRSLAFVHALEQARQRFEEQFSQKVLTRVHVQTKDSRDDAVLQAADYMIWALQRYYSAGEERFISAMWDKVGDIHAVDELDESPGGSHYGKKKPLPTVVGAA
jgi:hypothetical protein